ncbi:hypothetical protein ANN_20903 [Periplaneta americana]|uniref:DUF4817 domain-containing protein n=1 Tax=Periplaneta americana TaxID=6978 RepID=A0ABQ8SF06_PERAM|nr:hypothetical protein ANN_20903 [Periplaneta americana]
MSPGSSTEIYPAFAHIGLRENPGKNLNQVTCPDRESNPGHLVSRPDELTLFSTFCVNVKMQYTLNQRLFLVKQYWITNSITATQKAYQREFGVRNPPKRNTILGLVNKLETTGSLEPADLITPDFFLWGYLKDRVYATRPQTLDDLKHNITQEIQAIDNRVLQRVASNMERRVELCLMQDGGHFQHLL